MATQAQEAFVKKMTTDERAIALARFQGEAYLRACAVSQQARRLRDARQTSADYMADCWLLASALRSVIRAAEICLLLVSDEHRAELEEALRRADRAVPDAVGTRDALEHFDDYILGIGRKHRAGYSYSQTYTRGPRLEVRVGPYSIDVEAAEAAADHLASVVIVGHDHLDLLP